MTRGKKGTVSLAPQLVCEHCGAGYVPKTWRPCLSGKLKYCGIMCSVAARAASPVVREKISAAAEGRQHTEETKSKMSQSRIGKTPSEETKDKHRKRWTDPDYLAAHSGENHHSWKSDRREMAIRAKIKWAARGMLRRSLASLNRSGDKWSSTEEMLGYAANDLREHLESQWLDGMCWENYGKGGWVIDHVRPLDSFPLDSTVAEMNALPNLQPLWEVDNLRKGKRWECNRMQGG